MNQGYNCEYILIGVEASADLKNAKKNNVKNIDFELPRVPHVSK